jgi:hypothetical protein
LKWNEIRELKNGCGRVCPAIYAPGFCSSARGQSARVRARQGKENIGRKMEGSKMKISGSSFFPPFFCQRIDAGKAWLRAIGETAKIPESRWGFSSQGTNVEWVLPQECPEFGGGGSSRAGGVKAVPMHRDRTPSPSGNTERLGAEVHLAEFRLGLGVADGGLLGMHGIPESRCDFVLYDAGSEMLMPQEYPEIQRERLRAKC